MQTRFFGIIEEQNLLAFNLEDRILTLSIILDFYCHPPKLAIEVVGSIHNLEEVKQYGEIRQKRLELEGLIFLRFTNNEIRLHPEDIIQQIESYFKANTEKRKASRT